jgi:hypothetical protein
LTAVAADGTDTSFAAAATATDCDRVFLWQATARRPVQFGKKQRCRSKSLGITALAVTKGRALWVTGTGNPVATLNLWTASTTKRTPKALATATRDVQANEPVPIVVGSAGGGLLPYAQGVTVSVLRSDGRKAFSWLAPGRVLALAARNGRVAVASEGARVTVLVESDVTDVAMTAKGLLVQRGATLELRREADANEYPMTGNAQLADADAKWAAWSDGRLVHLIRLPDGAQVGTYPGTSAAIAGTTLYVANGKTITSRTIR